MTKIASLVALLATLVACLLPAAPAWAQRDRVFVASYGSDSNPCTFGSPCKTFQNAINAVAQGGEVTAIDSAGFGTIAISHAVTITSPNGVEAGIAAPASGGTAITIDAGSSDNIVLNGLTLDGDGVANTIGIEFNSGCNLIIQNSVIRNFTSAGIAYTTTSGSVCQLSVSNTLIFGVLNGASYGIVIYYSGSGTMAGVLDHVLIYNADEGIAVFDNSASYIIPVTVSDSVIALNNFGIAVGPYANVMVRNSTIVNNNDVGLSAAGTDAIIRVTRSTIKGNAIGWQISNGGSVSSYGDNTIDDNISGGNAAPPNTPLK
jgi:hypothetical protein